MQMSTEHRISDEEMARVFLPPVARSMKVLDRAFFKKTIPTFAAKVLDIGRISAMRKECANDILNVNNLHKNQVFTVRGEKFLLLDPRIKPDDPSTMSESLRKYVQNNALSLFPYQLELNYDDWDYSQLIHAILPEELLDDVPTGFTITGHIAHFNLRERYLPYKYLIAEMVIDKNPRVRTVVNKLESVGVASEFRTFPMEILAGDPDTFVEVSENDCRFAFDFRTVYWNSRLDTEHRRLANSFKKGQAVCDVMAGVGPFAMPAAKRGVIVWANDLNPESYKALLGNIQRNKVSKLVTAHNTDGAKFIRESIRKLYTLSQNTNSAIQLDRKPLSRKEKEAGVAPPPPEILPIPPVFSHFIMNLPATAIEFLHAFVGVYHDHPELAEKYPMPQIHVYCFNKPDDPETAPGIVVERIRKALRYPIPVEDVSLHDVRLVAPNKRMYCCTFTLPKEVALAEPLKDGGSFSEADKEDWKKWEEED